MMQSNWERRGSRSPKAGLASPISFVLGGAPVLVSLFNGLPSSPLFDSGMFYLAAMLPGSVRFPDFLFYLNIAFITLVTMVVAGVPAALAERVIWKGAPSVLVGVIWLIAAAVIALPGLLGFAGYFEFE